MHRHSLKTHPRPDRGALASLVYFFFPSQQQNIGGGAGAGSSSSGGVASGPVSLRSHARGRVSPRSHGAVSHGHSGAHQAPGSPPSPHEHPRPGSSLIPHEHPHPGSPQKQPLLPSLPQALPSSPAGTDTPTFGGGRETSPHRLLLPLGRGRHWARPAPGGTGRRKEGEERTHHTPLAQPEPNAAQPRRQLTARSGSGVSSGRRAPRHPLHGQCPLRLPSGAAAGTGSSAGRRDGGGHAEGPRAQRGRSGGLRRVAPLARAALGRDPALRPLLLRLRVASDNNGRGSRGAARSGAGPTHARAQLRLRRAAGMGGEAARQAQSGRGPMAAVGRAGDGAPEGSGAEGGGAARFGPPWASVSWVSRAICLRHGKNKNGGRSAEGLRRG